MIEHGRPDEETPFSLLDDDGSVRPGARPPEVPDADALALFRNLLKVRLVDERIPVQAIKIKSVL